MTHISVCALTSFDLCCCSLNRSRMSHLRSLRTFKDASKATKNKTIACEKPNFRDWRQNNAHARYCGMRFTNQVVHLSLSLTLQGQPFTSYIICHLITSSRSKLVVFTANPWWYLCTRIPVHFLQSSTNLRGSHPNSRVNLHRIS